MPIARMFMPMTQRLCTRAITVMAGVLLCCLLFTTTPTAAQSPASTEQRGVAEVAVSANLNAKSPRDRVSIRIVNNTNRARLETIIHVLGEKFDARPSAPIFATGDPDIIEDPGIGAAFTLPVVPRSEAYLPVAPFIEAFAPYVAEVHLAYIIDGPFENRGCRTFENPDATFTVSAPDRADAGDRAFYAIRAQIKNPALTSVPAPKYAVQYGTKGTGRKHASPIILLALAALIGISGGVLLAMLFSHWKAMDAQASNSTPTGGTDARKTDDH